MVDLPSILSVAAKNESLIKAIYDDLAAPGVRQVGKALETVLKTGNIVLLPLRMLNESAAQFERRSFEEIAARFKDIPDEDIVDVRPEIGSPIIERLSITSDPDLRKMFVELLASAADRKAVECAHPSFVRVIESLSPDEANILIAWKSLTLIPSLMIGCKAQDGSYRTVYDPFIEIPDTLSSPNSTSMYIANLAGLGLVVHRHDTFVTQTGVYDSLIQSAEVELPGIREDKRALVRAERINFQAGDYFYRRGCLEITPYCKAFQRACVS